MADVDVEVNIVVEITSRYRRCERHDLASPWAFSLNFEQDMEEWIMMKWYTIGWDREGSRTQFKVLCPSVNKSPYLGML